MRGGRAAILLSLTTAVVAIGCGEPEPSALPTVTLGPSVQVTLYGRDGLATDVWLAVDAPLLDPAPNVGFRGRDVGVACWTAPANASVVLLNESPASGRAAVVQAIGRVDPSRPMWVDIAADGSITSGVGVPPWWPSSVGSDCP